MNYSHTNYIESLKIAEIFKELEFNVDIVNYFHEPALPYEKYDVIFGFGEPLIKSFYNRTRRITTIFYGTGMHVNIQNHNTLKRVEDVYNKKRVWLLESGRIVDKAWSVQTTLVDGIITFGNQEVVDSYKKYFHRQIYNLPVTFHNVISDDEILAILNQKEYSIAKFHFLWFGSSGLIHKGLDLLLEYFSARPDLHLHICGPTDTETGFNFAYHDELFNTQNIHTYGFIHLKSDLFRNLMQKCLFIIYPSCSEGEPSSVINIMANGLIPIVTKEAGIKFNPYCYSISDFTPDAIDAAVNQALATENHILRDKSIECMRETRKVHSLESFAIEIRKALKDILEINHVPQ